MARPLRELRSGAPADWLRYLENTVASLKDWRGIATLYTRCKDLFLSAMCLAATLLSWLPT